MRVKAYTGETARLRFQSACGAIKGWVKAEWGQSENNRRARYYNLTPVGRKQIKREVADFGRLLEALLRMVEPT